MIDDLTPFVQVAANINEIEIPDNRNDKLKFLEMFEQLYLGLAKNYITIDDVFTAKDGFLSFDYQPLAMCRTFKQKIWDLQYELGIERKTMDFDRFSAEQEVYIENTYPEQQAVTLLFAAEYGYEQLTGIPYAAIVKDGTCDIYNSDFFDESAFEYRDVDFSNVHLPIEKKIDKEYSKEEISYMVHYPEVRQGTRRFVKFGQVFDIRTTRVFRDDLAHWTREEWQRYNYYEYLRHDALNPAGGINAVLKYYEDHKSLVPSQGNAKAKVEAWAAGIYRAVQMDMENKKTEKTAPNCSHGQHDSIKENLTNHLDAMLNKTNKNNNDECMCYNDQKQITTKDRKEHITMELRKISSKDFFEEFIDDYEQPVVNKEGKEYKPKTKMYKDALARLKKFGFARYCCILSSPDPDEDPDEIKDQEENIAATFLENVEALESICKKLNIEPAQLSLGGKIYVIEGENPDLWGPALFDGHPALMIPATIDNQDKFIEHWKQLKQALENN